MDNQTFFMVWVDRQGTGHDSTSTKKHTSLAEAQAEARRLAEKTQKPTYILVAMGKWEQPKPPITYTPLQGILL